MLTQTALLPSPLPTRLLATLQMVLQVPMPLVPTSAACLMHQHMVRSTTMVPHQTARLRKCPMHRISREQKAPLEHAGTGGRQLHPACEWKCRRRRQWTERSVRPLQLQRLVERLVLQPQVVLELELML